MSIVSMEDHFGCAIADISTGDCFLTEVDKPQKLLDEINKFVPAEIICNDAFFMSGVDTDDLKNRLGICVFPLDAWYFDDSLCKRTLKEHFHVNTLEGLGIQDYDIGVIASGALFLYLQETQKSALSHMAGIRPYAAEKYMLIDSSSRRNLELVETLREKIKEVPFCGCWTKQKLPWEPVPSALMWNSLLLTLRRSTGVWRLWKN